MSDRGQVRTCEFSYDAILVNEIKPNSEVQLDRISFLHGLILFTGKSDLKLFEQWKPSEDKSLSKANFIYPGRDRLCENKVLKPVSFTEVVSVSVKRYEGSGQRHTTDSRITKAYPLRPHPSL